MQFTCGVFYARGGVGWRYTAIVPGVRWLFSRFVVTMPRNSPPLTHQKHKEAREGDSLIGMA